MTLSVVIPAYDEARKIRRDVQAAADFFVTQGLKGEIIVVDDGSSDGTAEAARDSRIPAGVGMTVVAGGLHRGKGFAIRTGILASKGDCVLFADSGLTVPFENALRGLRLIQEGRCELAHGSRRLPQSVIRKDQDWDRKLTSRLFHRIVRRWMHVPAHLTDTQCGFKMYRGESARMLYAECLTEGFMFDIEIILRAQQKGFRILEFPVEWTCDRDSRIGFSGTTVPVLKELANLRRMLLRQT